MIRDAALDDLPALAKCYRALLGTWRGAGPGHRTTRQATTLRRAFYQDILVHRHGIILVAEERRRVIGMVVCEFRQADPSFQWRDIVVIQDLFVVPRHRRKGIGRILCREALARCKAAGRELVYLWLHPRNRVMDLHSRRWGFQTEYLIKTKRV